MRRRGVLAGTLIIVALSWAFTGVALASHHIDTGILVHSGSTEVEPVVGGVITVCDFHLHGVIDGDDPDGHEKGFWRITDTDAGGTVVLDGQFDVFETAPDRIPDSGTFTLPEGNYNLWWDHEPFVPGGSHREKDFRVVCGGAPTATASSAPTGSAAPTGSSAPTGSANPTGGTITLPPTDGGLGAARAAHTESSVWPIAIVLGGVAGLAFLLTPRPSGTRSRTTTRR